MGDISVDFLVKIFLAIFVLLGILSAVFPDYAWYIQHGMWYKDSEPTDEALLAARIGGIVFAVIGGLMLLIMLGQ